MAKPKIGLIFDDSLDRADGVQQQLRLMGRWFKSQKWPAMYFCSGTASKRVEGLPVVSLNRSFAVRANQNRLRLPLPISKRRAASVLTQNKIELVHVMLPFSPWLGGRLVKAAQAQGLGVVGTFHTYPVGRLQRLGSRIYGRLYGRRLRSFDRLFSVSAATAETVSALYGLKTEVQPNFVDVGSFQKPKRVPRRKQAGKAIVFVGRLVERKGPAYLISALGQLHANQQLNGASATIVGDGPLRSKLERQVERLHLNELVRFAGFVSENEKTRLLNDSDLAVFPATGGEAFGIVLLEAMAAGTVVLGGDNPGYRSVLSQEIQLIDPTDTGLFAQRIKLLLNDQKQRQKVLKSQSQALRRFDYQTVMADYAGVYAETLALKAKASHT